MPSAATARQTVHRLLFDPESRTETVRAPTVSTVVALFISNQTAVWSMLTKFRTTLSKTSTNTLGHVILHFLKMM